MHICMHVHAQRAHIWNAHTQQMRLQYTTSPSGQQLKRPNTANTLPYMGIALWGQMHAFIIANTYGCICVYTAHMFCIRPLKTHEKTCPIRVVVLWFPRPHSLKWPVVFCNYAAGKPTIIATTTVAFTCMHTTHCAQYFRTNSWSTIPIIKRNVLNAVHMWGIPCRLPHPAILECGVQIKTKSHPTDHNLLFF